MFLHEHEPNFAGSVKATRKVFDAMSFCDSISTYWETRTLAQDLVSQVCARATMFYNYKANRIARGFYKYIRPKWFRLYTQTQSLREELNDVMKSSGSSDLHFGEIDVPYLFLTKSTLTGSQYRLVSYLARPWNFTWETDRSLWDHKLSALDAAYRMAQLRERNNVGLLLQSSQETDEEDDGLFIVEDSENEDNSDDSFNDPVVFD
ncbi:unnamed protein product [Strongylus vulgaris]|uniref:Uncharacterized protein n=1 Tax=Strongylus vulgaris TaxID=40348 RepID=A0A3P7KJ08_STRVU|nr:unnamed protein product [Strongylus vulgaris]